jgi:hypothetical protein
MIFSTIIAIVWFDASLLDTFSNNRASRELRDRIVNEKITVCYKERTLHKQGIILWQIPDKR